MDVNEELKIEVIVKMRKKIKSGGGGGGGRVGGSGWGGGQGGCERRSEFFCEN